ncbi:hypothetical protein [Kitasatospora sp. NPDC093558]|uniref:hypothetical protein n=1 Tax=Kitasatospora sp. NPDC093558 TaxID=3155201 RepID=UPI00342E871D
MIDSVSPEPLSCARSIFSSALFESLLDSPFVRPAVDNAALQQRNVDTLRKNVAALAGALDTASRSVILTRRHRSSCGPSRP